MKLIKMCQMRTVNRSPVKAYMCFGGSVHIGWKCHGIDQDGNRQRWYEFSYSKDGEVSLHAPIWTGRSKLYLRQVLDRYEHSKGLQT